MLKLTRLLMLIAVALAATQPVMACCLTGHAEAETAHSPAEASPPCNGEASHSGYGKAAEKDQHLPSPTQRPGCLDCDSAVMQAQSFESGVLLTQLSQEIPFTASNARVDGFDHKITTFKTGPPGEPLLPPSTPITLKQILLI